MKVIERWEDYCEKKIAEGQDWIIRAIAKEEIDEWLIP